MSKNSEQLLTKLKGSLPRSRKAPTSEVGPHPITAAVRAPKLSVSLYQRDVQILDQIKGFMQQRGFRNLSDSEALRLACRAVEINDDLIPVYQEMQGEDGRRKAS
jgi:phage FluMu protein gp41